jgi:hypothetical protein
MTIFDHFGYTKWWFLPFLAYFGHFWQNRVLGLVRFGFGPNPLLKRRVAEKTFWGHLGFWGF